jgi:hypothetical protein
MKHPLEIIVFNEHTLGYREPGSNIFYILHASILKGAPWIAPISDGQMRFIDPPDNVRLAKSKDFGEFRVHERAYRENLGIHNYIYERE